MQVRRVALAVVAGFSLLGAWGCASNPLLDQNAMFHETQRRYTNLMRFTDFDRARAFVAPDARQQFIARTTALHGVHFTDYSIVDVENGKNSATVTVSYTGYWPSSPVVVSFSEQQQWELANNTWTVRPTLEEQTP